MDDEAVKPKTTTQLLLEQLSTLQESTEGTRLEAQMLRHEVRVIDVKRKQDRHLLVILIALFFVVIAGLAINYQTSQNIKSCTTPTGECLQRLAKANEVAQQLIILQIEDQRLTSTIDATRAALEAGSPTAGASLESYTARQVQVRKDIEHIVKTHTLPTQNPT